MWRRRHRSRFSVAVITAFVLLIWFYGVPSAVRGTTNLSAEKYSKTLVVACLQKDDVSWIGKSNVDFSTAIYVVDNISLSPDFRVPKNKGREAMVYLTYIIDHWDSLSDITIFTHPDLMTYHNNDLLGFNLLTMIESLSEAHVARQGYFNLRCHLKPGCPDWIHLHRPKELLSLGPDRTGEEQAFTLEVWHELHPGVPPPSVISQPCCAQFAVTRERIRANPRTTYIHYRDWLLNTKLEDVYSGRVLEYSWQYIFAGVSDLCPETNVCYCDGYGLCFGGAEPLDEYIKFWEISQNLSREAFDIRKMPGREDYATELLIRADEIDIELEWLKAEAVERGKDPRLRAQEARRSWRKGDGY